MKKQDILENQAKIVFLSIGSNLGNKKLNINKAKYFLQNNKIKIIETSSFYETESCPNKKFPKYLNIMIKVETYFDPINLFLTIKSIEKKLGRKKRPKNYPRICDIDIIDYDQKKISLIHDNQKLKIPHPRLQYRNFVLFPLFEISSNWKHPINNVNIVKLLSKINICELRSIKLI